MCVLVFEGRRLFHVLLLFLIRCDGLNRLMFKLMSNLDLFLKSVYTFTGLMGALGY